MSILTVYIPPHNNLKKQKQFEKSLKVNRDSLTSAIILHLSLKPHRRKPVKIFQTPSLKENKTTIRIYTKNV